MKKHSLEEIKQELFQEIEELERKDPSWLNCRHCPFKGKCCIDNDIDIRDDEWEEIKHLLDTDEIIRRQVKENFDKGSKCYFRTDSCCLIHPIRPTNCIYTPYQVIQNLDDHTLMYSRRSNCCDFEIVIKPSKPLKEEDYLLKLQEENHYYLFLNHWFLHYDQKSDDSYKEEAYYRLKYYFEENQTYQTTYRSSLGEIKLVSDGNTITELFFADHKPARSAVDKATMKNDLALFVKAKEWLDSYFDKEKKSINFPLNPKGTAFQREVWSIVRKIPYGTTLSYQDIAKKLHRPMSNQAIGNALAANPILLMIPCHRVIKSDGSIGQYSAGEENRVG